MGFGGCSPTPGEVSLSPTSTTNSLGWNAWTSGLLACKRTECRFVCAAYQFCESISDKRSQRRLDAYDIRVAGVGMQVPVSSLSCACAEGALLCCLTISNMVCRTGVFLQAPGTTPFFVAAPWQYRTTPLIALGRQHHPISHFSFRRCSTEILPPARLPTPWRFY